MHCKPDCVNGTVTFAPNIPPLPVPPTHVTKLVIHVCTANPKDPTHNVRLSIIAGSAADSPFTNGINTCHTHRVTNHTRPFHSGTNDRNTRSTIDNCCTNALTVCPIPLLYVFTKLTRNCCALSFTTITNPATNSSAINIYTFDRISCAKIVTIWIGSVRYVSNVENNTPTTLLSANFFVSERRVSTNRHTIRFSTRSAMSRNWRTLAKYTSHIMVCSNPYLNSRE